ncbi:hypothetical protein ACTXT7_013752 [Hymenolepis weldensis]
MEECKDSFSDKPLDSNAAWIRLKVEREGVQARNIIKYNLPFSESRQNSHRVSASKRRHGDYRTDSRASSAGNSVSLKSQITLSSEQSSSLSSRETSQRRRTRRRQDYHALYWGQMLDTLKRTIDEIYAVCELDECEMRCKEVIMILNHSEQDFKSLIEKMSILQQNGNRPASLAWDERKISPGRPIMLRMLADFDLSPSTLISGAPSTSVSTSNADALAWGSDEEDLLNDDDDDDEVTTHFDDAIKSVESTERLLRSELGREQASLRQLGSKKTSPTSSIKTSVSASNTLGTNTRRRCYACAEASRRSVAVETENVNIGTRELFSNTVVDLLTSGKPRFPGRGVQMHEKLLSQNRGRCGKSIQEIEAKQARARFLRQRHLLERSNRVRELGKKVEEVRKQKLRLIQQRRNFLEKRLLVAEENRRAELERRILKAHDEEIKGREIAFIQSLEAEQKQHTIFAKHEISCARLKERAENRRRRLEEKAEREEAAKLRRIELEALRLARLDELQARWLSRAHEIEARGEQTRRVRRAAAREREAHREMKLAALEQQQRQHIEELRSKILRKANSRQRECERRHQETLSGIRRKALEMATPQQYDSATASTFLRYGDKNQRGWCRLCRIEVDSPAHFDSQGHRTALLTSLPACLRRVDRWDIDRLNAACFVEIPVSSKHSGDDKEAYFHLHRRMKRSAEVERQRLLVKRLNVIRRRVSVRSLLYRKAPLENLKSAPACTQKAQLQKLIKEARRYCNLPESGPWIASRVAAIEKALHAIRRLVNDEKSLLCCFHLDLTSVLVSLIDLTLCQRYFDFPMIPARTVNLACGLLKSLCESVPLVPWHLLFNGDLVILIDCITVKLARLEAVDEWGEVKNYALKSQQSDDIECIKTLFSCLLVISKGFKSNPPPLTGSVVAPASKKASNFTSACLTDFVAYAVNSGLMEVLTNYLSSPNLSAQLESDAGGKIGTGVKLALLSLDLLTAFVRLIPPIKVNLGDKSKGPMESSDDPTFFFDAIAATEVFGVVSLLYDTLQMSPNHRPGDCHDNLDVIGDKLQRSNGLADIVLGALKLINHAALVNLSKIQEVVSNDTTSVQIRHIFGLLFSVCAPNEDDSEPVKDISSPVIATVTKAAPPATSGGCLAGKRRRNGSALIPSGAKEVGVKVTPKADFVSTSSTSGSSKCNISSKKPRYEHKFYFISASKLDRKRSMMCDQIDRSLMSEILHEAIVCLGYLTSGHFGNQTRLCVSGQTSTPLLLQLCQLPLSYFSQPQLADILFPTLITSCFAAKDVAATNGNMNVALLASHLNPALLANFVEARSLEKTLAKPTDDKNPTSSDNENADDYHQFENRFPPSLWKAAKSFFAEAKNQISKSNTLTTTGPERE